MVVLPLFLSSVGLAIDGEAVMRAHRRAQGAADGAARTGVGHVQIVTRARFRAALMFWMRPRPSKPR